MSRGPTRNGLRPQRSQSLPAGTWTSVLATSGPAMNIATGNRISAAVSDVERCDRKHGGDAREHDQLSDQQPECGVCRRFPDRARTSLRAMRSILRFWGANRWTTMCYGPWFRAHRRRSVSRDHPRPLPQSSPPSFGRTGGSCHRGEQSAVRRRDRPQLPARQRDRRGDRVHGAWLLDQPGVGEHAL